MNLIINNAQYMTKDNLIDIIKIYEQFIKEQHSIDISTQNINLKKIIFNLMQKIDSTQFAKELHVNELNKITLKTLREYIYENHKNIFPDKKNFPTIHRETLVHSSRKNRVKFDLRDDSKNTTLLNNNREINTLFKEREDVRNFEIKRGKKSKNKIDFSEKEENILTSDDFTNKMNLLQSNRNNFVDSIKKNNSIVPDNNNQIQNNTNTESNDLLQNEIINNPLFNNDVIYDKPDNDKPDNITSNNKLNNDNLETNNVIDGFDFDAFDSFDNMGSLDDNMASFDSNDINNNIENIDNNNNLENIDNNLENIDNIENIEREKNISEENISRKNFSEKYTETQNLNLTNLENTTQNITNSNNFISSHNNPTFYKQKLVINSNNRNTELYTSNNYKISFKQPIKNVTKIKLLNAFIKLNNDYCILKLNNYNNLISNNDIIMNSFSILYKNKNYYDEKYFDEPLSELSELNLTFLDYKGNLYNFKDDTHLLEFEIEYL